MMAEGFEIFPAAGGEHGGDANEEGKFGGGGPAQTQQQGQHDGGAGTRSAGENGGNKLAEADGQGDGPRDLGAVVFAAQHEFNDDEGDAADEEGPADGTELFGKFDALLVNDEPADAGEGEGEKQFGEVSLRGGFAPTVEELAEALGKKGQHSDDGAAVDDDIKEVGLVRQPVLGYELNGRWRKPEGIP